MMKFPMLYNNDCLQVLPTIPPNSVHLTFTSPPYFNAREYASYESYEEYLSFLLQVFSHVHDITMEGRFLIVNTSPVIEPRKDRQHQSKRYPIPFDLSYLLTHNGWDFIDDIVWVKPETSVKNRNGGFFQHRKPLGYKPNIVTEYVMVYRKHTEKLLDFNIRGYSEEIVKKSMVPDGYETSNVWEIPPKASKEHPAIFPLELAERVIRYWSYEGDTVLDCFMGSGTSGMACKSLRRNFIGIERDEKYFKVCERRILHEEIVKAPKMLEWMKGMKKDDVLNTPP